MRSPRVPVELVGGECAGLAVDLGWLGQQKQGALEEGKRLSEKLMTINWVGELPSKEVAPSKWMPLPTNSLGPSLPSAGAQCPESPQQRSCFLRSEAGVHCPSLGFN